MNRREISIFAFSAVLLLLAEMLTVRGILGPVGQLCLYMANLFALYVAVFSVRRSGNSMDLNMYLLGWLTLFIIFFLLANQPLMLALFVLIYAGLYHIPGAVGYLMIFAVSFGVLAPFSIPVFLIASVIYAGLRWLVKNYAGLMGGTFYLLGSILFLAILLPMAYMATLTSFQDLTKSAGTDYVRDALRVSIVSSTISTAVILMLGVPLAYVMARWKFRGHSIADTLIDIPILIPQPVVGIALLTLLGGKTLLGQFLKNSFGVEIAGTMWGICAAQVFVSSPFLIRAAMNAFQSVDPKLEYVAQTLGAHPLKVFFMVTLPLASKGIFSGGILSWARAISEYGSLAVIAYTPASAPVLIYDIFNQYGVTEARPVSVLLVIVCLWAFITLRVLRAWSPSRLFTKFREHDYDTSKQPATNVG